MKNYFSFLIFFLISTNVVAQVEIREATLIGEIPLKTETYSMLLPKRSAVAGERLYIYDEKSGQILLFDNNLNFMSCLLQKPYFPNNRGNELCADESGRILIDGEDQWFVIDGQERLIPKPSGSYLSILHKGFIYAPLGIVITEEGSPILRKISTWGVQEQLLGKAIAPFIHQGYFSCRSIAFFKENFYLLCGDSLHVLEMSPEKDQQRLIKLSLDEVINDLSSEGVISASSVRVKTKFVVTHMLVKNERIVIGLPFTKEEKRGMLILFHDLQGHLQKALFIPGFIREFQIMKVKGSETLIPIPGKNDGTIKLYSLD